MLKERLNRYCCLHFIYLLQISSPARRCVGRMSDFETHRKSTQTLSDFGGPGLFQTAHFRLNVNAGLHAGQPALALVCFGNGGAYGRSSADSATRKAPGIFHHCLEHSGRPGGGSRRSVCWQISLRTPGVLITALSDTFICADAAKVNTMAKKVSLMNFIFFVSLIKKNCTNYTIFFVSRIKRNYTDYTIFFCFTN